MQDPMQALQATILKTYPHPHLPLPSQCLLLKAPPLLTLLFGRLPVEALPHRLAWPQ